MQPSFFALARRIGTGYRPVSCTFTVADADRFPRGTQFAVRQRRQWGRIVTTGTKGATMRYVFACSVLVLPWLAGCAGFVDEVTSRDFKFQSLYTRPNPMLVLRDSTDGDQRAKALRTLREPRQSGGSDADQDAVVGILVAAATTEKQPLCRLAAIQSLSRFQDPRAVQGLSDAFFNATAFAPDTATVIRCQAVTALGKTGSPQALELLARVAREPQAEGTEQERQQALDVRIAAARALANYNQPQAAEALVRVMRGEKDVALRDRAYESLQVVTGKRMPVDDQAWDAYLQPGQAEALAQKPGQGPIQRVMGLFEGTTGQ